MSTLEIVSFLITAIGFVLIIIEWMKDKECKVIFFKGIFVIIVGIILMGIALK